MTLFFEKDPTRRKIKIFFLSLPSFFIAKSYVIALFNNNDDIDQIAHSICNNVVTSFFLLEEKRKKNAKDNDDSIKYCTINRFKEYVKKTEKICHHLFEEQTKELVKQNKNVLNFPTSMTLSAWGTAFNIAFYTIALVIGTPFIYATPIFISVIGLLFIFCAVSAFFGRNFINYEVEKVYQKQLSRIHEIDNDVQLQGLNAEIIKENEQRKKNNYGELSAEEAAIINALNIDKMKEKEKKPTKNEKSLLGTQSVIQESSFNIGFNI